MAPRRRGRLGVTLLEDRRGDVLMWESAIAVIGTLAGGLLVAVTQQVTDRRQQREQHRERVADVTGQLLSAVLR
ncbi:hypothetical protein G3M58_61085, partial [Streptomyces sp. SID7499]|nr:hypothetical protein [Streptomyces sp. SID7499]